MARRRFHGLKRPKIRASWNKFNLYNISRLKIPNTSFMTFFQQKWAAKKITRAYHGEMIREKQWNRMFSPNLRAVVPMDPQYLAEYDGSELASGRGSGLEGKPLGSAREFGDLVKKNGDQDAWAKQLGRMPKKADTPWKEQMHAYFAFKDLQKRIPYNHQTFAPMERRLDIAIWRSLFASSARQARQMVVHGKVKVNGHKMPYPGYLLNPGDMFQVEPDSVQYATADKKNKEERIATKKVRRGQANMRRTLAADQLAHSQAVAAKKAKYAAEGKEYPVVYHGKYDDERELRDIYKLRLQGEIRKCEERLATHRFNSTLFREVLRGDRRKKYRAFNQNARKLLKEFDWQPWDATRLRLMDLIAEWRVAKFRPSRELKNKEAWLAKQGITLNSPEGRRMQMPPPSERFTMEEKIELLRRIRFNTLDKIPPSNRVRKMEAETHPEKPYPFPFRPKPFMSAFAFIPRYLEVHHKICSAVYLRHPVARPGLSEVPTPFPGETMQLAHQWYLRRR